jgi:hypothetical protein
VARGAGVVAEVTHLLSHRAIGTIAHGRIWPLYDARLRDLAALVAELDGSLDPRGIVQWFNASLRYLGGLRPADLLHVGEIERVTEAAQAFAAGSYL